MQRPALKIDQKANQRTDDDRMGPVHMQRENLRHKCASIDQQQNQGISSATAPASSSEPTK